MKIQKLYNKNELTRNKLKVKTLHNLERLKLEINFE